MKTLKKISYSLLLAFALLFSVQINVKAAPYYPDSYITSYSEHGKFIIHSGQMIVRNYPGYNEPVVTTYGAGDTFYYDSIYNFNDTNHYFTNHYASYISNSGIRRYVYYGDTKNGVYKRVPNLSFTNIIF